MVRARRKLIALQIAAVVGIAGCGGGGDASEPAAAPVSEADRSAITSTAVKVVTVDDKATAKICKDLLTPEFVTTVFLDQKTCQEPSGSSEEDLATGATVTDIRVDGDTATARVTDEGGSAGGASGLWTFRRDGATWRLHEWSTEYLRAGYAATFGPNYKVTESSDPFGNVGLRGCFLDRFVKMDDETFRANAYEVFRASKKSDKLFEDLLISCGAEETAPGRTRLREVFEDGLRAELGKELPQGVVDCVVTKISEELSQAELEQTYRTDGQGAADQRLFQRAGAECAKQAQT